MAKIKFTAIVAEMRNSIAGTVFSRNRYGSYARTKVTPINPQTSYQQEQRQRLSNLSSSWRALTVQQMASWSSQVHNYKSTDIFGDVKVLSGQALFVSLNLNLERVGEARIDAPLSPVGMPAISLTAVTAAYSVSGDNMNVTATISPAVIPADFALVVYVTSGVSAGISFVKNLYRWLGVFPVTAGVATLGVEYTGRLGNAAVGDKIYIKIALVSLLTGQIGIPIEMSAIVTSAV